MSGFDFSSMLGANVQRRDETIQSSTIGKNKKVVGLYFSAHWCPPCRGFTPKLAEYYKKNAHQMEIVFLSSDRSEDEFNGYYETMDWLALPYAQSDTKKQISEKHGVRGIPTLVILDAQTGNVITATGRDDVLKDEFPWSVQSQQQSK